MFNKLNAPHTLIVFAYKGLLRALAEMNIGILIYGLLKCDAIRKTKLLNNETIDLFCGLVFLVNVFTIHFHLNWTI